MPIPPIIYNNSLKFLSGLASNSDSIVPMAVKDTISNCAIVHTYKKEGGKDDARERAIEEFGTGFVWLFGIPIFKKLIDKLIYPLFKLNANLDVRTFENPDKLNEIKEHLKNSTSSCLDKEKEIFASLNKKSMNAYKNLFVGKFAASTVLSAILLSKIIKYKQKTTQKRIEDEFQQKKTSSILIKNKISKEENNTFSKFISKNNESNQISFTGSSDLLKQFMYNDRLNTLILDGVITGTRLKEGRKGEKKEILLKELFQIFFIYKAATIVQSAFEFLGNKLKLPIELDPVVLFDKNLSDKLSSSKDEIKEMLKSDNIVKDIYNLNVKNPILELLDKDGVVETYKDKQGNIQSISYMKKAISETKAKKSLQNLLSLNENIKNLGKIKAFKLFSIFGNIAIAAWAMGVLQPKVNIFMRKLLNNGDNRNPAIVQQEKEMYAKQNEQS